ncbi:MAG: hypothetical protein PVG65_05735, partial [Candidatus Thorarchaeota archaeon]
TRESTNFSELAVQATTENITNLTLEIPEHGKIVFNEVINISRDIWNLDNESNIFSDTPLVYAYIDANELSEFNTSATIYFYNLDYTDYVILADGQVCPSSQCSGESYSGGTLRFNVTHMGATYTISGVSEETTTPTIGGGGGGGGGGSGVVASKRFSLDKDTIKISLKPGESKQESLTITNLDSRQINLALYSPQLENFLTISERNFQLMREQSKTISLWFNTKQDISPDLYFGSIRVAGGGAEEKILVALEVESEQSSFDVEISSPDPVITAGEELILNISLLNFIEEENKINLEYTIKDEFGNEILSERGTITLDDSLRLTKALMIPANLEEGKYTIYIKAYNKEETIISSIFLSTYERTGIEAPHASAVLDRIISTGKNYLGVIILVILLILASIILMLRKKKK